MTIDHQLFLWDYTDPRGSFYQYDGLDQTIIHASLVVPRRGVFEEGAQPQWLLLLSTPVEVILFGLYTNGTEIDIYETGFSVPTDGARAAQSLPPPPASSPPPPPPSFLPPPSSPSPPPSSPPPPPLPLHASLADCNLHDAALPFHAISLPAP